jgi:geranylgeranyl pyrophosphate synthase
LLSYLAAGGNDAEVVVDLAAAVELVHTATLVHDDINDHSPMRRGKVAVHAQYGRTFALLTGDYLFTRVYTLMAPYGQPYNEMMAAATVKLVEGETLQAAAAKDGAIDQATYKQIIARKTASLFEAAARMGAVYARGHESTVEALAIYASNLGLAFQIIDDVLDVIGDPETMGKPVGSDLNQGAGVMLAQNGKKALATVSDIDSPIDPIKIMIEKLRDSGAVDIALAQAREYAVRAHDALAQVPPSPARDELATLLELVVERQR